MPKRILSVILSLCLFFATSAIAEKSADGMNIPNPSGQVTNGDFTPPNMPQGEFDPSKMPQGDFAPPSETDKEGLPSSENINNTTENTSESSGENTQQSQGQFPFGGFPGNMQNGGQNAAAETETGFMGFIKTYSTPITSVILLGLAYLFVIFYKRKHY